jgi:hypothetical protein
MAVRDDPMSGEDVTIKVYRWAEKESATGTINGTNTTFTVANTVVSPLNLTGVPLSDLVLSGGGVSLRDFAVFARKNGVDTRIDNDRILGTNSTTVSLVSGTAVTAAEADSLIVSYPYTSTNDGTSDFTFYVKDYNVKFGDRDISEVRVTGGKSYKRRTSQGLTEATLDTIKKDVLLSQILNGDLVKDSSQVSSLLIKSTIGGGTNVARLLFIDHKDPDNVNDRLVTILRNVKGASLNYSGGADKELGESITVKCNPEDSCDLEINDL